MAGSLFDFSVFGNWHLEINVPVTDTPNEEFGFRLAAEPHTVFDTVDISTTGLITWSQDATASYSQSGATIELVSPAFEGCELVAVEGSNTWPADASMTVGLSGTKITLDTPGYAPGTYSGRHSTSWQLQNCKVRAVMLGVWRTAKQLKS